MANRAKRPPGEALVDLRRRLALLPPRDPGRPEIMARMAGAYGVSVPTLYRALREVNRPKSIRRADFGRARVAPTPASSARARRISGLSCFMCRKCR